MNLWLRFLFIAYLVLCLLVGAPLLLAPGRFLGIFSWAPIDPLITRLLGAALLGMAWGSWRAIQKPDSKAIPTLIEVFMVFTMLGGIGMLRNMLGSYWWPGIWGIVIVLFAFAFSWILARIRSV